MTRDKRWVVRPGDGATVGDLLAKMREGPQAIAEGRVFVGRRRAMSVDDRVREGDEVRVGAAARASGAPSIPILFEKDGLVACNKPAGIPTVPDHAGGAHSLVALVARQLGREPSSLRITSRLDREVSGVVVFALDADAEARLVRERAAGGYHRRYVALARPVDLPGAGVWDAPIGGGRDARHRAVAGPDAKVAATHYLVVARAPNAMLLAVDPVTGRTHQIRVHASHAGAALLGDRDYGGDARLTLASGRIVAFDRIALHAARVTVPDRTGAPLEATAPIPPELARPWTELGGEAEAWNTAVACVVP